MKHHRKFGDVTVTVTTVDKRDDACGIHLHWSRKRLDWDYAYDFSLDLHAALEWADCIGFSEDGTKWSEP